MFRILILISLFPIAIALVCRWWFGLRVLATEGKRACHCNLESWQPDETGSDIVQRSEASASNFGCQLRNKALATWKQEDPKAASAREGAHRFGFAVPPLSGIVAVFAMIVGKIPVTGAIAIFLIATALAAAFNLLSLPHELRAISRPRIAPWTGKASRIPSTRKRSRAAPSPTPGTSPCPPSFASSTNDCHEPNLPRVRLPLHLRRRFSDDGCWCARLPPVIPIDPAFSCRCPDCLARAIAGAIERKLDSLTHSEALELAASDSSDRTPVEHIDFTWEGSAMVFTRWFLLKQGSCCGSKCRNCPYPS